MEPCHNTHRASLHSTSSTSSSPTAWIPCSNIVQSAGVDTSTTAASSEKDDDYILYCELFDKRSFITSGKTSNTSHLVTWWLGMIASMGLLNARNTIDETMNWLM